jgi:hypothetical protein
MIAAIIGWVLFIVSKLIPFFFMSKKEKETLKIERQKANLEIRRQANSQLKELGEAYKDFMEESSKFCALVNTGVGVTDFASMTVKANNYFDKLISISEAVLENSNTLPDVSIRHTFFRRISETVEKEIIESYYDTLKEKIPAYTGSFDKEDYKAIFVVYDSYINLEKHLWNRLITYLISILYKLYIKKIKEVQIASNEELPVI